MTGLFPPYFPNVVAPVDRLYCFIGAEDDPGDLAPDQLFCLRGESIQVFEADVAAHEDQVDAGGVASHSHIAGDVRPGHVTDLVHHPGHQLVDSRVLAQNAGDIGEQGMVAVGTEHLAVLHHLRQQQPAFFEPVQLQTDGIGAVSKLLRQASQVAPDFRDEEELRQELETCLAADQDVQHGKKAGLFTASPVQSQTAGPKGMKYFSIRQRIRVANILIYW